MPAHACVFQQAVRHENKAGRLEARAVNAALHGNVVKATNLSVSTLSMYWGLYILKLVTCS